MRDILLTLIVITGCFFTLKRPYIGILLLSWLSFMNPQSLCYGFALKVPFAQWTGIVLLGSMVYNKETKLPSLDAITMIWIAFIVFMGITTLFAYYPVDAALQYKEVVETQLIMFLTLMLITDMDKLNKLIWVIVLSMGYYSVKGGFFTILTGGSLRIWGPPVLILKMIADWLLPY
jgi:probable O-glycosylation ligase (exosortase A-associated)